MKRLKTACALCAIVMMMPAMAYCVGIGGYFTGGYGSFSWVTSSSPMLLDGYTYGEISAKQMPRMLGGGLIFDSNLAKDRVFNFRMKAGYHDALSGGLHQRGIDGEFIFGLAPVRERRVRFWLGPLITVRYLWGDARSHHYASFLPGMPGMGAIPPFRFKRRYETFCLGTGLALGVNINVARYLTLALEVAGRGIFGMGSEHDVGKSIVGASVSGFEGSATAAIILRFGENP